MASSTQGVVSLFQWFRLILGPEKKFYSLAAIYTIGISLLSLATPVSVQMLINTVANAGLPAPLIMLSLTLFGLLLISGLLNALRLHLLDIFARRFYARMVGEIALRSVFARNPFFLDDSQLPLFNRYFDIVIVLKTVPNLLVGGLTVVLQSVIGFLLVSLYHPLFLGFNVVLVFVIWLIWVIWGKSAISTAVQLSHKKHAAAAWLEQLGVSDGFFKSRQHTASAFERTEEFTADYVDAHKKHFRQHFAQSIAFFLVYAAASATLLGLGGWLVIQGELTLGQLVAAELVLSAAFYGVSQMGLYLTYFYDCCAAVDELSLFFQVDQEKPGGEEVNPLAGSELKFVSAGGRARGREAQLDFAIPAGATVMAVSGNHGIQRLMTNLLKRQSEVQGGYVQFGGQDLSQLNHDQIRKEILVLDRPRGIETTIRQSLEQLSKTATSEVVWEALELVGLKSSVTHLKDGLDTKIASTGWPLSVTETLRLKLAGAIITGPRVVVLTKLFDALGQDCLRRVFTYLQRKRPTTIIYFTNARFEVAFDHFLYLDYEKQWLLNDYGEFEGLVGRGTRDE